MWDKLSKVNNINTNIRSINEYFANISDQETERLFIRMKDIFYFYGFTGEYLRDILEEGKMPENYPDKKLPELEGVTNAVLFRLKYRRAEPYSVKGVEKSQRSEI